MQIKPKGSRIYLLRSSYDPTKKRSVQEVLGSAGRSALDLEPEVAQKLRPEEVAQWESYRAAQIAANQRSSDDFRLDYLVRHLEAFHRALAAHPEAVDAHLVEWVQALGTAKTFVNDLARKRRKAAKKVKPAPPQGTPLLDA